MHGWLPFFEKFKSKYQTLFLIISSLGFQLVSFDYSQLELRVLAYLSKDNKLTGRLTNDKDFFISLAADLLKKFEYEITSEQRQNAKQVKNLIFLVIYFINLKVCYGILYGMSNETFARETRMNITEAEEFIENFSKAFPIMTEYINNIKRRVNELGYVQSIYGRLLYFDLNRMNSNEMVKARVMKTNSFF